MVSLSIWHGSGTDLARIGVSVRRRRFLSSAPALAMIVADHGRPPRQRLRSVEYWQSVLLDSLPDLPVEPS
jgi:hypothetical protein